MLFASLDHYIVIWEGADKNDMKVAIVQKCGYLLLERMNMLRSYDVCLANIITRYMLTADFMRSSDFEKM